MAVNTGRLPADAAATRSSAALIRKSKRLPLRPIRPRFVHHRFCRSRRIWRARRAHYAADAAGRDQFNGDLLIETNKPLELRHRRLGDGLRFDAEHPLVRLLCFDGQHIARRNEPHTQLIAHVGEMRVGPLQCLTYDIRSRSGCQHSQKRAGDLQLQVGARGITILSRRVNLGAGSTSQRVRRPPV